jgi:hypothetical protein
VVGVPNVGADVKRYAWMNVQCTSEDGKVGDLLTDGASAEDRRPISPVFDHLGELFEWMKTNGWETDQRGEDGKFYPWRVSKTS